MEWRTSTPEGNRGKAETPQARRGGSASSPQKARSPAQWNTLLIKTN